MPDSISMIPSKPMEKGSTAYCVCQAFLNYCGKVLLNYYFFFKLEISKSILKDCLLLYLPL